MKIYISGPITGYDLDERRQTFDKARKEIEKWVKRRNKLSHSHTEVAIFSPPHAYKEGMTYAQIMRYDIEQLLTCDLIVFLTGWQDSRGCKAEREVAKVCGIKILFDNWQP